MALLDMSSSEKLPPLECLFTVDEETGLTGAFQLDGSMLTGRTILNLDTEEFGKLYIGCAGGGESKIKMRRKAEIVPNTMIAMQFSLSGLSGGHSGVQIHEYLGNSVVLGCKVLKKLLVELNDVRISSLHGGDQHNAIPRDFVARLWISPKDKTACQELVARSLAALKREYGTKEPHLNCTIVEEKTNADGIALCNDQALNVLRLTSMLPNGPVKYSHEVEGLVETSNNVASITTSDENIELVCSTRSFLPEPLKDVRDLIQDVSELFGATVEQSDPYPGWAPSNQSEVLGIAKDTLEQVLGRSTQKAAEPIEVLAIHAGLECGILAEKCPDSDIVSFGPTIRNAHTPEEAVLIPTVSPFWDLTLGVLSKLADRR